MKKQRVGNKLYWNIFLGLVVVLIIIYGINIFATGSLLSPLKGATEKQRPTNLYLTLITNNCTNCFDMNSVVSFIKKQNVKVLQERNLTSSDKEAQDIIIKQNISSLPTLVITGETLHGNMTSIWRGLGAQPVNGVVVIGGFPPYYSLDKQKVVGVVQVIMLNDSSCAGCYNVETHLQILSRFGVFINKSVTYDILSNNGKDLLQKYNITKIPTIILSSDASVYSALNQVWTQVGTTEKDGYYVFRDTGQMGTYKDLSQSKVINATG
ncbi:MAG: hypothetical protein HYW23_02445 [Candidatus Aenigmarchaeota archaeon]|nr:hypothetical protein [Candidatus Aenigmarchaeota archaeon]